jgi:2'-deoxynucleoside 5'-phosphate N-hydrolase
MMKAYISLSFSKRKSLDKTITAITDTLRQFKISSFVFVDHHQFDKTQEKQMMNQAMLDLDHCELLIAETSDKAIGIGVEVGYAKAKGKPVIYVRQKDAEHSTTVSGISDFQVIFTDTIDLKKQLADIINKIHQQIIVP